MRRTVAALVAAAGCAWMMREGVEGRLQKLAARAWTLDGEVGEMLHDAVRLVGACVVLVGVVVWLTVLGVGRIAPRDGVRWPARWAAVVAMVVTAWATRSIVGVVFAAIGIAVVETVVARATDAPQSDARDARMPVAVRDELRRRAGSES